MFLEDDQLADVRNTSGSELHFSCDAAHHVSESVFTQVLLYQIRSEELSLPLAGQHVRRHDEDEEEDEDAPPPVGGDKKRKAGPSREAEGSKKGRTLFPDRATMAIDSGDKWLPRDKPLAKS